MDSAGARLSTRRMVVAEIWLVLALSLGTSAVYAVLDLLRDLSSRVPLSKQAAVINAAPATGNSLLDLAFQLVGIAATLVPVALVVYLLLRSGESPGDVGLDRRHPWVETGWGAALAAVIGGAGLVLYLTAYHLGLDVRVVPTTLPAVWWRIPVLLLAAVQEGVVEEVVMCGYLLRRLDQLGWRRNRSLGTSAVIRGTYHLYQGFGGFVGNLVMGAIFGRLWQRQHRLVRLVVAHSLIDAVAFVGYVALKGKVSWIP